MARSTDARPFLLAAVRADRELARNFVPAAQRRGAFPPRCAPRITISRLAKLDLESRFHFCTGRTQAHSGATMPRRTRREKCVCILSSSRVKS